MNRINFAAVILAAGSSTRMGQIKQLLRFKGKTMLEQAISAALGAGIASPVVVLGASADRIIETVALLRSCDVVINKDFTDGQATSLHHGVAYISGRCDAAIFMLADQPLIDSALVLDFLKTFSEIKPDILYPTYKNQRGNPVIIDSTLFPRLLKVTGDEGARSLLGDTSLNRYAYAVDTKAVLTDIDTWEDYVLLKDA